ncbi:MAG TPA: DNA double-strand break repair nuclease NurA [Anaerolineales bacterium]|nr:DNA double-strand break repair nuclease NurA [Anaerolineales bacterium]
MSLDFQQIRNQVKQLGEHAHTRQMESQERLARARLLLDSHAANLDGLRQKVQRVVREYDASLRCALPEKELLNDHFALPALPAQATVLAADGSQIFPDRHAQVDFGLINVGVIQACYGSQAAPQIHVTSRLLYDDDLYSSSGILSDSLLALRRDLSERTTLAKIAVGATPPVVTFTDGLMEIWGARDLNTPEEVSEFQKSLNEYLDVLTHMQALSVLTAGYVDSPRSSLVVRLLEVAMTPDSELPNIKKIQPLRGITDIDLYYPLLSEGERSPVFSVQSPSIKVYKGPLALHFFYVNVGRPGSPSLARVEIPAWVAENPAWVDLLQSILVDQCRIMGSRNYPYLLHRAHETAVVTLSEKEQVVQMIAFELSRHGIRVGGKSQKQSAKDLPGRKRYGV